ncbi:cob(I)yrinic acid a,c-diamide adenosyltransferase [bacterium BMS3Abin05]|nr:cob(I)yrinic acid a,c-diamide adenosyltransferase [bacterium BMS3Abin05]GBE28787.1 cob(I)yrinic acid a,c-diamide adenosyltransferase [bacterium BMS3Bbin03]HDL78471.1 cob(I)yrinic acid a,c-diamide adenosyltransferase [Bacteroidota bacterium]HDZ12562.1 cob(I)yrinic acid a,c-diamide adenosyltransferase [Bacteroidota bacterium]
MSSKLKKGYIQVYTGDGKGKTTAALGLAFRAAGNDFRVYIGQFMKGQEYGELKTAERLAPNIVIEQFGKPTFVHVDKATEEDIQAAQNGLARLREVVKGGLYDIVIMDEVNVALYFKLITVEDVLEILENKPASVEIILTGRYAPRELIDRADLVTEMKEIKHYFARGVPARMGIEK